MYQIVCPLCHNIGTLKVKVMKVRVWTPVIYEVGGKASFRLEDQAGTDEKSVLTYCTSGSGCPFTQAGHMAPKAIIREVPSAKANEPANG